MTDHDPNLETDPNIERRVRGILSEFFHRQELHEWEPFEVQRANRYGFHVVVARHRNIPIRLAWWLVHLERKEVRA